MRIEFGYGELLCNLGSMPDGWKMVDAADWQPKNLREIKATAVRSFGGAAADDDVVRGCAGHVAHRFLSVTYHGPNSKKR